MNIKYVHLSGGSHVVILGAGASIASALRNPEKHGLSLPSMNDLPKVCGLDGVLNKFPENLICDNFEATYSNLVEHDPNNYYLKVMNDMIYSYFRTIELPDEPTIYDYLVMSLRDKDAIATFNWDPFLYQAWWRNYHHGSSPQMIYLHGNVAVGYNQEKHMLGRAGMYSNNESIYFEPTQLLFPVKHKDYNKDSFIRSSWQMLQDRLDKEKCNTHNVTIFGYSAPVTDVEALSMMKSAWGISMIEILNNLNLLTFAKRKTSSIRGQSLFILIIMITGHLFLILHWLNTHVGQMKLFFCHFLPITPEEAFVEPNPVPLDFKTLKEMWDWYEPLIDKERRQ